MTLDAGTVAVYETQAEQWATARRGTDLGPAHRLRARLSAGHRPVLDLVGRRVPGATPVRGAASALPFRTGSIGGAVVSAVSIHLDRPELPLALAELHRVLALDAPGELVLSEGDQELTPLTSDSFPARRISLWPDARLRDVVVGAGFDIARWQRTESDRWSHLSIGVRRARSLPDTVGPDMRLLICGLNPSLHAADMGVGFGRPGNRFWPAALAAGLVTVDRDPRHALTDHGIGMTDLVKRATARADEIPADLFRAGLARIERLCDWLRPAAVCMVGLMGWRAAVDRTATVGWQPRRLGPSPVYVMPSTSGLNARSRLEDLVEHLTRVRG